MIPDDRTYGSWRKFFDNTDVTNGYCQKDMNNMNSVSNQRICGGVARDIGFYFKVDFSVDARRLVSFTIPTDFGFGGISVLDGEVQKNYGSDMWSGGRATQLNFNAQVEKGDHTLELMGGEGCCDGTTRWSFKQQKQNNDGSWENAAN